MQKMGLDYYNKNSETFSIDKLNHETLMNKTVTIKGKTYLLDEIFLAKRWREVQLDELQKTCSGEPCCPFKGGSLQLNNYVDFLFMQQ